MWTWMQRNLAMDDLWSFLGYLLLVAMNAFVSSDLPLAGVSAGASGMLAIVWVLNGTLRGRSPKPNARVVFWTLVAVASVVAGRL